jgi:hypothetical protein
MSEHQPTAREVSAMATRTTWKPRVEHGELSTREHNDLPDSVFAFPEQRKEPLTDSDHVRNALARFDQVKGVSDSDRDLAFANIRKAAEHFHVSVEEKDWHELGKRPHTKNAAQ